MALYVTRPRRDEVRIGRGLPSGGISSKLCTRLFVTKMAEKIWITSDPRIIIGLGRHNNNICLFKSGSLKFAAFYITSRYCMSEIIKKTYTINQSVRQCTAILQCLLTTFVLHPILNYVVGLIDWLFVWIEFYAVSAIFQPCNGGSRIAIALCFI